MDRPGADQSSADRISILPPLAPSPAPANSSRSHEGRRLAKQPLHATGPMSSPNISAIEVDLLGAIKSLVDAIVALENATNSAETDDVLAKTSNRLALSALVVALAALVVSSLQAALEYMASDVRLKCSRSAIGAASRLVRTSWSWRMWRWKYYYPEINFKIGYVFRQLIAEQFRYGLETSYVGRAAISGREPVCFELGDAWDMHNAIS
jgi:hypothetical protein